MEQMKSGNKNNGSSCLSRSRLFNLEPIGIGTPYIESLRSYIARLASNHYVRFGDLIKFEILGKLGMTEKQFDSNKCKINKFGPFTEKLVSVLEELTSRTDLGYLTLKKWESAFIGRFGIFHQYLKWCPLCLMSFRNNKQEIYEPLIWTIYCIKICPKHKIELASVCPHCDRSPRPSLTKMRPGYCTYCQKWLGENILLNEVTGQELERQLMISKAVGELLSNNNVESPTATKERITNSIKIIMKITTNGRIEEFAKKINKSRQLVGRWKKGKKYPEFESLIDICEATNIKAIDLLLDRLDYYSIEITNIPYRKKNGNRVLRDLKQIEKQLEDSYLYEYPPPSLIELRRRLNYVKIGERFPTLNKKIKLKYHNYKETQKEIDLINRIKEVEIIMKELHSLFEYPSVSAVRKRMKKPFIFSDPIIKETYNKMLKELGLN